MNYLVDHEEEIYPRIAVLGERAREIAVNAFLEEGVYCATPRYLNEAVKGSSLSLLAFPYEEGLELSTPADVRDPAVCDVALGEEILQLALLVDDVFAVHGLGAISSAHTQEDLERLRQAYGRAARLIKGYL